MDIDACTGCQKCETACTVAVPDQFNADLVARRAAHIAFPQAVPKKAVIDRAGSSPCSFACPAGIQAHGYVSLIRSGLDEEAFRLVLEATPLVGTLGRACYAPCEGECTRGSLEGTLPIRRLKRFASDRHDASGNDNGRRAARAQRQAGRHRRLRPHRPHRRLAARQARLRRQDLRGGPGRRRLPPPGHPVLPPARGRRRARHRERHRPGRRDRDRHAVSDDPAALRADGFDAVLVATGTHRSTGLGVPGEDRLGVLGGTDFLRKVKLGQPIDLAGKRVVVVGGGNVAMDAARIARRLGAASGHGGLPPLARRDAGPPRRVGRRGEGGRGLPPPGRPGRGARRRRTARSPACAAARCASARPDASGPPSVEPVAGLVGHHRRPT